MNDIDQAITTITQKMVVKSRRQFLNCTYSDIARQAELLLTKIQANESLEGENAAKLRQKLLKIEIKKPFMTFDAIELADGGTMALQYQNSEYKKTTES